VHAAARRARAGLGEVAEEERQRAGQAAAARVVPDLFDCLKKLQVRQEISVVVEVVTPEEAAALLQL
jgi:hypothetical protein